MICLSEKTMTDIIDIALKESISTLLSLIIEHFELFNFIIKQLLVYYA